MESRKILLTLAALVLLALPGHAQPGGGPGDGDPGDPPRDTPGLDPVILTGLASAGYVGYQTLKAGAFRKRS